MCFASLLRRQPGLPKSSRHLFSCKHHATDNCAANNFMVGAFVPAAHRIANAPTWPPVGVGTSALITMALCASQGVLQHLFYKQKLAEREVEAEGQGLVFCLPARGRLPGDRCLASMTCMTACCDSCSCCCALHCCPPLLSTCRPCSLNLVSATCCTCLLVQRRRSCSGQRLRPAASLTWLSTC